MRPILASVTFFWTGCPNTRHARGARWRRSRARLQEIQGSRAIRPGTHLAPQVDMVGASFGWCVCPDRGNRRRQAGKISAAGGRRHDCPAPGARVGAEGHATPPVGFARETGHARFTARGARVSPATPAAASRTPTPRHHRERDGVRRPEHGRAHAFAGEIRQRPANRAGDGGKRESGPASTTSRRPGPRPEAPRAPPSTPSTASQARRAVETSARRRAPASSRPRNRQRPPARAARRDGFVRGPTEPCAGSPPRMRPRPAARATAVPAPRRLRTRTSTPRTRRSSGAAWSREGPGQLTGVRRRRRRRYGPS